MIIPITDGNGEIKFFSENIFKKLPSKEEFIKIFNNEHESIFRSINRDTY